MKTRESREKEPDRRETEQSKKSKHQDVDTRHPDDNEDIDDGETPREESPDEPRREQVRKLPKRLENPEPKQRPEKEPAEDKPPGRGANSDRHRRPAPEPAPDTDRRHFGRTHESDSKRSRGSEH